MAAYQDEAILHVTLKDPKNEPGYLSRPRLLRQTADVLDQLGEIDVHSLVLHEELTDGKWVWEWVSFVTVYYSRPESLRVRVERQEPGETDDNAEANANATPKYTGDQINPAMAEDHRNCSFRLNNPQAEPDYLSVSKLLRRTADAVDSLDKVEIDDLVLHTEVTAAGRVPTVAVYYSRPTRADKKHRKEWVRLEKDLKRHAQKEKRKKEKEEAKARSLT